MKKSNLFTLPVLMVLALVLGMGSPLFAAETRLTDQAITNAVENELLFAPRVSLNDITVRTKNGVVTLTGTTDNLLAKDRAADLAETVKGVRSVIDQINVEPFWGKMDWEIESDAQQALLYNATTDAYEVDVEVEGSVATLTGTVESVPEKRLAEKVVKGVRGVAGVVNLIDVEYEKNRSESEILNDVTSALKWDALVDSETINVTVDGNEVELSGIVGSVAEKSRAIGNAFVSGVISVDAEELDIKDWAEEPKKRAPSFVPKSDKAVEDAITDALSFDPRVSPFTISVDVDGNTATLRGTVDNLIASRAAMQIAKHTVGIYRVKNRIKVRPNTPTDDQIEENIEAALIRDPILERYKIDVDVENGVAFLTGEVDSFYEKGEADHVAASAYGVKEVRNALRVDRSDPFYYDPYVYDFDPYDYDWYTYEPVMTFESDSKIKEEIGDQMFWSPFVDADEVTVTVEDGTAILTGAVDSWFEKRKATENAYEGGAVWVRNNLSIQ